MSEDPKNLSNDPEPKPQGDPGGQEEKKPVTYETWLESQPDEVKSLIDGNTSGLKSALEAERHGRGELDSTLKSISKLLDTDPKGAKDAIEKLRSENADKDLQLGFYEDAVKEGIKNPSTAYKIAQAEGLINSRGVTNFTALKETYPELFTGTKPLETKGGEGGQRLPTGPSMSDRIRGAAGYGRKQ